MSTFRIPMRWGERGFEDVYDLGATACRGLLEHLRREHDLGVEARR